MKADADGLYHICSSTPPRNPDGGEMTFRPEWRTEAVEGLARGIREDRAFERMPILADALEEAGCDVPSVLLHCRGPIAHVPDCWVLGRIFPRTPPDREPPTEVLLRLLADFQRQAAERRVMTTEAVRLVRRFRRLVSLGCAVMAVVLILVLFAFVILTRHLDKS